MISYFKNKFKNKIFKETFWSFATKGVTVILFFLIEIYLARFLGVAKYGAWSFFLSVFNIILLISYFGVNSSSKKYVAQYNNTPELKSVIKDSVQLRFVFSLLFATLLLFWYKPLLLWLHKSELQSLFLASVPLLFFAGFLEYFKNIFIGIHRMKYHFIINCFEYGLKLLFILIFLSFSNNLILVVHSYSIAALITIIVGFLILYIFLNNNFFVQKKSYLKEIFYYSIPLMIINIGFIIATEIDVFMLGMYRSDYEVGIYAISKQIVSKLPQISLAISAGVMPVFAKMTNENKVYFNKLFYKLLKINTLIFSIISLCILLFSSFFVPFLFGNQYSASVIPLLLLIPYIVAFSYSVYIGRFLDYQGLAGKRAVYLVIAVLLNILFNYLLIPRYGASGAAIATSVSYTPYVIILWFIARKELI